MKHTILISLSLIAIIFVLAACSENTSLIEPEAEPSIEPETPAVTNSENKLSPMPRAHFSQDEKAICKIINKLGFEISNSIDKDLKGEKNTSLSPTGIAINLAMLNESVDENTSASITNAFGAQSSEQLSSLANKLLRYLPCAENGSNLILSNSVWVSDEFTVPENFKNTMADIFGASVNPIDITDPKSCDIINLWCKNQTDGIIYEIIDHIEPENKSIWINALMLNGVWETPFDREATSVGTFNGTMGKSEVYMMHCDQKLEAACGTNGDVLITLPFKGTTDLNLYLPADGQTPSYEDYAELLRDCRRTMVHLDLPRFETSDEYNLSGYLASHGVNLGGVELTPMNIPGAGILTIYQKCSTSVDEDGARAAAITYTSWCSSTGDPDQPEEITVRFDRPFRFTITDFFSGIILMTGSINNL